jgi:hypothetical protein
MENVVRQYRGLCDCRNATFRTLGEIESMISPCLSLFHGFQSVFAAYAAASPAASAELFAVTDPRMTGSHMPLRLDFIVDFTPWASSATKTCASAILATPSHPGRIFRAFSFLVSPTAQCGC